MASRLFGGGLTLSGVSPGPSTLNLNLNSSDSRELDQIQLRLGDGEEGTLRTGHALPNHRPRPFRAWERVSQHSRAHRRGKFEQPFVTALFRWQERYPKFRRWSIRTWGSP